MSPEDKRDERRRRRLLARFRFKSLVRKVMVNRIWLSEIEDTKLGENVRRNVAIITRRKGAKGVLDLSEKRLFNTPLADRTIEQQRLLTRIIIGLKCFERFSPKVRSRLTNSTFFQFYNAGRTIIREGQHAVALYFILSGEVTVSKLKWDKHEKRWIDTVIGAMGCGDMFGEVALLNNIRRVATCTTAVDSEFLCIYKSDFDRVLSELLRLQWDQVQLAMKRFEYFQTWSKDQFQECCILSRIQQYSPNQTIYDEDKGLLNSVYFVLSGSCIILQCLNMLKKQKETHSRYKLIDDNETLESVYTNIALDSNTEDALALKISRTSSILKPVDQQIEKKYQFVEVGIFSSGSVFGLGEEMNDRTIVAKTFVQCLQIPRYWLFLKEQNTGNIWQRTKMYLDSSIPSRQKLFIDYLKTRKWRKYRKNVVEQVFREHPTTNPTLPIDIPIICRIEEELL